MLMPISRVLIRYGVKSRATIWRRVKAGDFPAPVVFGSRIYWREDELDAWAARLPRRNYQTPTHTRPTSGRAK